MYLHREDVLVSSRPLELFDDTFQTEKVSRGMEVWDLGHKHLTHKTGARILLVDFVVKPNVTDVLCRNVTKIT